MNFTTVSNGRPENKARTAAIEAQKAANLQGNLFLPMERTSELETFYDLCLNFGGGIVTDRFSPNAFCDSRESLDTILEWTNEFNALHAGESWEEKDYIETVDDFFDAKVKQYEAEIQP